MGVIDENGKMGELISVIGEMSSYDILQREVKKDDTEIDDSKIEEIYIKLKNIYQNDFRHEYSRITECLQSYDCEQRDTICDCLEVIRELSEREDDDQTAFSKNIRKLYDHVKLEHIHISRLESINQKLKTFDDTRKKLEEENVEIRSYNSSVLELIKQQQKVLVKFSSESDKLKQDIESTQKAYNDIEANQKKINKKQNEVQKKLDAIDTQSITVLSIFTGIAMAFFGGFSLLGSAFERLGQPGVSFLELLILVLVIGLILFDTVYLLLFCVSKINNHPLVNPDHKDCTQCDRTATKQCKNKRSRYINFIWKYPLPSWVNIWMLVIIAILFIIAVFHNGLVLWHF